MAAGALVGATIFVVILILNFAGSVTLGRGRQGIAWAAELATRYALPFGLWAGSIIAVSASARALFSIRPIDKVAGTLLFGTALAVAITLITTWIQIWVQRIYYSIIGVFPLRLLDFLDDFSRAGVLRRVGYSYELKYPVLSRAIRDSDSLGYE